MNELSQSFERGLRKNGRLNLQRRARDGAVINCMSAGCSKKPHAAKWLFDHPRMHFPMCDAARESLMNPPKEYQPGCAADSFTSLPLPGLPLTEPQSTKP